MNRPKNTPRCSEKVYHDATFRSYQCTRTGKIQRPDGRWYCTQHDPEKVEARRAAIGQRYSAQSAVRNAQYDLSDAKRDLVAACLRAADELPPDVATAVANVRQAETRVSDASAALENLQK